MSYVFDDWLKEDHNRNIINSFINIDEDKSLLVFELIISKFPYGSLCYFLYSLFAKYPLVQEKVGKNDELLNFAISSIPAEQLKEFFLFSSCGIKEIDEKIIDAMENRIKEEDNKNNKGDDKSILIKNSFICNESNGFPNNKVNNGKIVENMKIL